MVQRSPEKLTIDSAFRVPKCNKLAGAFQKLQYSKDRIYGVTPFTELPQVTLLAGGVDCSFIDLRYV